MCFQHSWLNKNGSQASTSSASGFLLFGGLHFTTLQIKTSFLVRPIASIIFVRSFPALPTKGSPCSSSSLPGPSPTNTSLAFGLPSPKTILFLVCFVVIAYQKPCIYFLQKAWHVLALQSSLYSNTPNHLVPFPLTILFDSANQLFVFQKVSTLF